MSTDDKMVIIDPRRKGIVYENNRDFSKSVFAKVYDRAKKLTENILCENEKLETVKHHGNEFRNNEQVDNVIAFIGRRGTGKTSSMLSFMEGLKDHHKEKILDCDNRQYKFMGLEWIDASLLEKNEDIFDTILAKMFGEYLKRSKDIYGTGAGNLDFDNRELYQQFERIYSRLSNLKRRDRLYEEGNSLNILRDLARSNDVRQDFAKLVKSYISFMEETQNFRGDYCRDTYLVIAIDDIDLNVDKGYEILEQIHRYLMVPGLIVLIAINYEEMLLCCEKRYAKAYEGLPNNIVEDIGDRAIQMSEEYLEKVLPPYMRVYLPSLKKTDYALRDNRRIKVDGEEYGIKEAIFKLVWRKTRVFYDTQGKKRHFMEPVTLRNLSTNFQLYEEMEIPLRDGSINQDIYDENYHKVMDDILFRFASDSLQNKEYRLFIKWSEEVAERRGEEIINAVIGEMFKKDNRNIGTQHKKKEFFEDYNTFGYSYGELVRVLYCISRFKVFDKRLVHVLLDQYTVVFSRIYERYKQQELPEILEKGQAEKYQNREKLKRLMGKSVGGSWAKYIVPRAVAKGSDQNEEDTYWGACKYGSEDVILASFAKDSEDGKKIKGSLKAKDWASCQELLKSEYVKGMTLLMFFFDGFTNRISTNGKYTIDIEDIEDNEEKPKEDNKEETKEETKEDAKEDTQETGTQKSKDKVGKEEYRIKLTNIRGTFNIFNFVQNSFNYYDVIHDFYVAIVEAVSKKRENTIANIDEKVRQFMEEQEQKEEKEQKSLLREFREWSKLGGLAVPVYNLDITYNLLKRLVLECQEDGRIIEIEDTFEEMRKLFKKIENQLEKQDKFYYGLREGEISNLQKTFEECPVVKSVINKEDCLGQAWNAFKGCGMAGGSAKVQSAFNNISDDPGTGNGSQQP